MNVKLKPWYEFDGKAFRFRFGIENCVASREAAQACERFSPDDEDEQIDDTLVSCYNCMKRRWLIDGVECIQFK
ncbi:hypothetical protein [Shewanella atlantica]|uniref:hypothetical protein n=1 Tax=Shewanella atlantica TaxID=271099 RepID=UPI0037351227